MTRGGRRLHWVLRDIDFLAGAVYLRLFYYMEDFKVLVGTAVNTVLTLVSYLVLWTAILSNTHVFQGDYGTWDIGMIVLLVGFSELAFAVDSLLTYGLALIPGIIHEEGLEAYSIYPVSTLSVILGRYSEPIDGFAGLLVSSSFITASHLVLGTPLSLKGLILGLVLLSLGLLILSSVYLLVAALSFRLGLIEAPVDLVTSIYTSFSRVPHDIYPHPLRAFLTFIIPVALLSTYPALLTAGSLNPVDVLSLLASATLLALLMVLLAFQAWRRGRGVYEPVGG